VEKAQILALFDQEQRIDIEHPGVTKTVFADLVRFVRPAPGRNYISYSKLASDELDQRIQAEIDYFSTFNQPFSWHYYEHDRAPELVEKLFHYGFAPDDDPDAVMLLDLEETALSTQTASHIEVRKIGESELDLLTDIEAQVWGGDFAWLKQRLSAHLSIENYLSIYLGVVDGTPACSGWIYFYPNSQFAGLYGGATLATHRQQGLYSAVLAARIEEARQRGYRFVYTGASRMSQPILAHHGFQLLTRAYAYDWESK
jgi:GNAT superfamily N-acetyltransferase